MNGADLHALVESQPLLADGGLGTALIERGVVDIDGCLEILNVERPSVVLDVHRRFVEAGAKLVETNTFGANRFGLAKHGLEDRVEELNRTGVEIAKQTGAIVAGSVGPLRVRLAPYGRVSRKRAREAYAEQISALSDAGADVIFIETQSDINEIEEALKAARSVCDLAVVVLATFTRDDRTLLGSTPEEVASKLVELKADGIGANCSEGPAQVLRIVHAMQPHIGNTPLVAKPNAGGPARAGQRIVYPATPEYLADYARAFVASGASIVGGCCGTHPEHIKAMAEALKGAPDQLHLEILPTAQPEVVAELSTAPTPFETKLREGRFVISVEMDPPRSTSTAKLVTAAETLAEAGADAINVADSPMARMRMSPWAPALLIQERAGIETILHFPTRGRNLLRIQGDLLAAHALGIRNLFVVLGDPARIGEYPAATDNVDVVPTGLISLVTESLNKGKDRVGASIGEPTDFLVGCAVNLAASDLDKEARLMKKKIDSGAHFALSMPAYSVDPLRRFRKAYEESHGPLELPILVGVLPLVTSRHAEFLHNELPGVSIPDEVRDRMSKAGDKGSAEGRRIAVEVAGELRSEAAGIYLMAPFSRYDIAAEVVEAVKE
jgi:methionine synthase I (cobalamin-dependent)/5,10-methylenetetrahydrofolate reductase